MSLVYEGEVVEFYVNLEVVDKGRVKSQVHGVQFELSKTVLGEILHVVVVGYADYDKEKSSNCSLTTKFTRDRVTDGSRRVLKGEMGSDHKLLFKLVNKCLLPRTERRHETSYKDLGVMDMIDTCQKVNLPLLMIKHMTRVITPKKDVHGLAYVFFLTKVFEAKGVPLGEGKKRSRKEMFDRKTPQECDCVQAGPGLKGMSLVT